MVSLKNICLIFCRTKRNWMLSKKRHYSQENQFCIAYRYFRMSELLLTTFWIFNDLTMPFKKIAIESRGKLRHHYYYYITQRLVYILTIGTFSLFIAMFCYIKYRYRLRAKLWLSVDMIMNNEQKEYVGSLLKKNTRKKKNTRIRT